MHFFKWKNRVVLIEQCVVLQFYRNSANDFFLDIQRAGFDKTVHGLTFL